MIKVQLLSGHSVDMLTYVYFIRLSLYTFVFTFVYTHIVTKFKDLRKHRSYDEQAISSALLVICIIIFDIFCVIVMVVSTVSVIHVVFIILIIL